MKLHLDFETRSAADLKKVGAMRYAQDVTTDVLIACWRIDQGAIKTWRRGEAAPSELIEAVAAGATVCAHNAMFELAIWTFVCEPMGWGKLSPHQMDCTMSRAYVMALQGSLDRVTSLMHLKHRKGIEGRSLIQFFSVPRKPKKDEVLERIEWNEPENFFEKFETFVDYCQADVEAECGVDEALPQLSPSERDVYHFDLVVNLRGFRLDTELMRKADAFIEVAKKRIDKELNEITDGAVPKATQLAKLKAWLNDRGIVVDTMGKGDIEEIIDNARLFEDEAAEAAVELRRLGAKATSLAKYKTGIGCVGFDERARGLLGYHKAATGRWAGSLYQPHNLERIDPDTDADLVVQMLHILRNSSAEEAVEWAELMGYVPMRAIGKCTRAMIVAAEGKELIGCDYSNVEGRGSAWLAGEAWKLDAFRAYDEGTGPDLYKLAYSKSFGEPVASIGKGPKRQIGKVQELALGYQGGVGAFMSMGANYGLKPKSLHAAVKPVATVDGWDKAASRFEASNKFGLHKEHWTALRYVVDGWRAGHPKTVQCWWDIQDAVIAAVDDPGTMQHLFNGKVRVYCQRNRAFMFIYLPSGRPLAYFKPVLSEKKEELEDGSTRLRRQVIVEGWDSRRNAWGHVSLYGGLLWENVIQALCRDLLAHGMMNCERAGYPTVLHVHDEGVYEVPVGQGSEHEVKELMAALPAWAQGFPLTSAAWRDRRYVK